MENRKRTKFLWIIVLFSIILFNNNQFVYAEDISATNRHLIVNYTRPEADYQNGEDGWRLWVWEDEGDGTDYFGQIENGTLVFDIQISSECKTVGMLLHKSEDGEEWAEKDGEDRFVEFPVGQNIKKVNIKQGEAEVVDAPDNQGAQYLRTTDEIKFYYRNDTHYYNNTLESLNGKVNVEVDGCSYAMTYDAENKRYEYTVSQLAYGKHYYRYVVDGETVLDPYNTAQEEYQGETYSYLLKEYWETEENGTQAQASVIPANQAYKGLLSSGEDIDYYMVNINNTGYFQLQFQVMENTGDIAYGWNVLLLDKDLNTIKKYSGVEQDFTTAALPMTGDYYIKVEPCDNRWDDRVPIGCIYSVCAVTTESDIWENEQNDTQGSASELSVDKAYNGTLHGQYDIDWYKVNVEKNGYFQLQFNVNESDVVNYGWYITIFDKNQNVIKAYGDLTKSFESVKLPHQPGEYYIKVEPDDNGWADRVPIDCIYSVCIVTTESDAWEIETNDDKNFANMISVGKSYSGMLYKQHDVDWYKVTVSKKGYFQLQFDVDAQFTADDINYGWKVSVLDNNQNEIAVYTKVGNSFESVKLPHQPGEYYIKVEPDDNGWADRVPIDCIYSICVVNTASNSWEMEGNDNEVSATNISVNKAYNGKLYKRLDVDWYKVKIDTKGYFKLQFNVDDKFTADDINDGWKVSILDNNENVIKEYTSVGKSFESIGLPFQTGNYYVKVEPQDNYYTSDVPINCIYSVCVVTKASNIWEIEGNNDEVSANKISANKACNGMIYKWNDVDWYKVKISTKGYFQLKFNVDKNAIADNINSGWRVSVLDSNQNVIKEYTDVVKSFVSVILPYQPGDYYVKVEPQDNYYTSRVPIDCIYSVCVATKSASNWEIEGTNGNSSVAATAVNKTVQGALQKASDVDWYRFNISNTGYFQLKFDVDKKVLKESIQDGWKITILDANLNEIKQYVNVKAKMSSAVMPYAKGMYYVRVERENGYYNNKVPVDCIYTINMVSKASSSFESETNNKQEQADKISLNKEYHGILSTAGDVDWYKFTVSSKGKVLLKFSKHSTVASSTVGTGWYIEIYQGTKLIQKYETIRTSFKYTAELNKGTYYVKVMAQGGWNATVPVDRRYTVKATFTAKPAASSIKSISTKSKTVTLSWNQSSKATGYYVYRSTSKNGTYRKIATIKNKATVKYTDKYNLKKNTQYYYKVVSYTTANGLTVSANSGNVKAIKVK